MMQNIEFTNYTINKIPLSQQKLDPKMQILVSNWNPAKTGFSTIKWNANIQPNFNDDYVWLIQPTSKLLISVAIRI